MKKRKRIFTLDAFKWIAAFLVVAIHTSPLESESALGDFIVTGILARVAVPFFFMLTGFFTLNAAVREKSRALGRAVCKLTVLYLGLTLLYLPVTLYQIVKGSKTITLQSFFRDLIFDGTFYHLWYLPACILGLIIVYFLLKLGRENALIISIFLYLAGLLGDSYFGLMSGSPFLNRIYTALFHVFSYTRNGIFMAPLFLLLGYLCRDYRDKRMVRTALFCAAAFLGMTMEALLLHGAGWQKHDSMYLCLPFVSVNFFHLLLEWERKRRQQNQETQTFSKLWINGPMLVYFLHPLVILVLRGAVKITHLSVFLTFSPLYYISVCLISFLLSAVLLCIRYG